ncbi:holin [Salmonella phage vB_SpuS_NX263]|nr:holin [Salmonella phage vB_SpuS_NX263]
MKKLSNWFVGVWLSFCSYLELWPDSMTHVWMFMPDDLKSEIPDSVVKGISYSVLVLSMFGKMHAMNKANKRLKDESKNA